VTLRDRRSDLLVTQIDLLRAAVAETMRRAPFAVDAWVVLPEHMHCIWTLPPGDDDYSGRWREVKKFFSRRVPEERVWQPRFWEHTVRDERDYAVHVDYVHFNPVKHGLVERVADWRFSSFHRAVRRGEYPADWADVGVDDRGFGEAS
jgi:putative transposase